MRACREVVLDGRRYLLVRFVSKYTDAFQAFWADGTRGMKYFTRCLEDYVTGRRRHQVPEGARLAGPDDCDFIFGDQNRLLRLQSILHRAPEIRIAFPSAEDIQTVSCWQNQWQRTRLEPDATHYVRGHGLFIAYRLPDL